MSWLQKPDSISLENVFILKQKGLLTLINLLQVVFLPWNSYNSCRIRTFLTCATLDASCVIDYSNLDPEKLGSLELYTREYINRIHIRRVVALKKIAENT